MTRIARALGLVALCAPLAGLGLLTAAPAYAATGITAPGGGVAFTSDTTVRITAALDSNSGSAELRLKSPVPGSTAQTVNSASSTLTSGATLKYDFDTATCASFPAACSGRAEAPNGDWTITLVGGGRTLDSRTFTLRIPPRVPTGVTAAADGYRAVVVSWRKGDEPDLTGWTLYGDGGIVQDGIGTSACSGTTCSTTVTYAADGTGTHTYALTSHRSVAPGSSSTLESARSADVSATLDSPPPPPPADSSGSGTSGGSTSGTTGGTSTGSGSGATGGSTSGSGTTGGTTGSGATGSSGGSGSSGSAVGTSRSTPGIVAQRRQFALTFKAFAPKLGIPKLPPLPSTAAPAVAPLPDGSYEKTLGYQPVVTREKVDAPQAAATRLTGAVGSALDSGQFLRSLAGALVLLLVAAHLRRWLGTGHSD